MLCLRCVCMYGYMHVYMYAYVCIFMCSQWTAKQKTTLKRRGHFILWAPSSNVIIVISTLTHTCHYWHFRSCTSSQQKLIRTMVNMMGPGRSLALPCQMKHFSVGKIVPKAKMHAQRRNVSHPLIFNSTITKPHLIADPQSLSSLSIIRVNSGWIRSGCLVDRGENHTAV